MSEADPELREKCTIVLTGFYDHVSSTGTTGIFIGGAKYYLSAQQPGRAELFAPTGLGTFDQKVGYGAKADLSTLIVNIKEPVLLEDIPESTE